MNLATPTCNDLPATKEDFTSLCIQSFSCLRAQGVREPYEVHISDKLAKKLGYPLPDYVKIIVGVE